MAAQDELNTSAIAVVGFVGAVVVFAIIVILMIVFYQIEAREQYQKDISQAYGEVGKLVADQQGRLASYGWVNREKGIAHIPISRAKDLVVAELSQGPKDEWGAESGEWGVGSGEWGVGSGEGRLVSGDSFRLAIANPLYLFHSLLPTLHSLLSTPYSPLSTPYSPLPTLDSLLARGKGRRGCAVVT